MEKLFNQQLAQWPLAKGNFDALKTSVQEKLMDVCGFKLKIQFNEARAISTAAKLDPETIRKRKCFLCPSNRPAEQLCRPLDLPDHSYDLLINPYPIFDRHFVIADRNHALQLFTGRMDDMLELSELMKDYVVFYNGPASGASAPDHFHFQACPKKNFKFVEYLDAIKKEPVELEAGLTVHKLGWIYTSALVAESETREGFIALMKRINEDKYKFNAFCWYEGNRYHLILTFRTKHRPAAYFYPKNNLIFSPGAVDMSGTLILPRKSDFDQLDAATILSLFHEVQFNEADFDALLKDIMTEKHTVSPEISVGVLTAPEIGICFEKPFRIAGTDEVLSGERRFAFQDGKIVAEGRCYPEILLIPEEPGSFFWIHQVIIGLGFHWERPEEQKFSGKLKFIVEGDRITAVNLIDVESYLVSVISSEMKASASFEFLKAHSVISRSWLLAQIRNKNKRLSIEIGDPYDVFNEKEGKPETRIEKWYDREDHQHFDVCADDHCQRYQGFTKPCSDMAYRVVESTRGEVLMSDGVLCDARFSKCCGGEMELFSTCWEEKDFSYLRALPDSRGEVARQVTGNYGDLTLEPNAVRWISEAPESFCNTKDESVLKQVLNDYDLETKDF